jgi:MFS family permease
MFKAITRSIWLLSIVSFLTDVSTEMLYPITPLFLKSIGYGVVLIGVIEGVAEAIAGLSKSYFGELSDRKGVRIPFIRGGYWLSAIARPMMAAFTYPVWILFSRSLDLFGKGLRTSARDALLSDESNSKNKSTVFGFHRAMDTLGAVVGPSLGLLYLYFYPGSYRLMFLFAFVPALAAGLAIIFLKEKRKPLKTKKEKWSLLSSFSYIGRSPVEYKKLLLGLLIFTLFNSSNAFLILKVKESGVSDIAAVGVYIFYNLVYALFSYPMGLLADRFGSKTIFIFGLVLFAVVYAGIGWNTNIWLFYLLFFIYGLYMASTEGISRAWISNIADKEDTGSALGIYAGLSSILTLFASIIAGLIWSKFSPQATFYLTAGVTIAVVIYFIIVIKGPTQKKTTSQIHQH